MKSKKVNAGNLQIISSTTFNLGDGFYLHCAEGQKGIMVFSVYRAGYECFAFVTTFYAERFDMKEFKKVLSEDYYLQKINHAIKQLL